MRTDTAHAAWNDRWATEDGRADWLAPEPDVTATAGALAARGRGLEALDLGCGVGRHALALARMGFHVTAVDLAQAGLDEVERAVAAEGLTIETAIAGMTDLPFADASFDYLLAFNVIYHGDETIVRRAIAEIARVLKPGGTYQGTMLSKRNAGFGVGIEVAPDTFVRTSRHGHPDDADKDHPHFYCNAAELVALFAGFELTSLKDVEHSTPGSWHWHWHMIAERIAGYVGKSSKLPTSQAPLPRAVAKASMISMGLSAVVQ